MSDSSRQQRWPSTPPPYAPPGTTSAEPARPAFQPGVPLGGTGPQHVQLPEPSQRRELAFVGVILVAAVAAALASLLSWRDYGQVVIANAAETGWVLPDGSMGRGWVAVALGVVLASAGVCAASERTVAARWLAVVGGAGLVTLAVAEWGLGAGELRTGPGIGIWLLFTTGVLVLVAVGTLGPGDEERTAAGSPQGGTP